MRGQERDVTSLIIVSGRVLPSSTVFYSLLQSSTASTHQHELTRFLPSPFTILPHVCPHVCFNINQSASPYTSKQPFFTRPAGGAESTARAAAGESGEGA